MQKLADIRTIGEMIDLLGKMAKLYGPESPLLAAVGRGRPARTIRAYPGLKWGGKNDEEFLACFITVSPGLTND